VALSPLHALAQTDEQRAAARDLAGDGADAYDQGKYADAIDKFSRAESLMHAVPHLLYLARSHAKLKQYVKAREAYMKIINEPLPANASQAVRDGNKAAQSEITAVESRIGKLTVQVEGKENAKDLVVSVNGAPIPAVLVGAPQPVDPGEHRVEATATGFKAEPQTVVLAEAERKEIVLKLVPADGAVAPVGAAAAATTAQAQQNQPPADSGSSNSGGGGSNGLRIGSYVALGVGVVGLGVGTVFMIQSSSKRGEADDLCNAPGGGCPVESQDEIKKLDDDADSAGAIGTTGLIVGGVGVAAGVVMFILSSGGSDKNAKAPSTQQGHVVPWIGPRSVGLSGTF
jgi:hypothetical protein